MELLRFFVCIPSPAVLEELVGNTGKIIIGLLDW